ncbi:MAG: PAS domain S-box protein [Verrucomicrobia bacterium]|nr:PAS domain S-box protein [Verrucomicrobiota bacterium]
MTTETLTQRVLTPKLVARLAAMLAIVAGGMVLVGWVFDLTTLKSILPGWVSVKPNTAIGFMLTGFALLLSGQSSEAQPRSRTFFYRLGRLCGMLAGLIGLLTLVEYACGCSFGFDQWLFSEPIGALGTSNPGRMAPDTALCFLLIAAGLEVIHGTRSGQRALVANIIFGSLVATLALTAIVSYFMRAFGSHGWFGFTIMAVPTAALFVVLGGTIVFTAWRQGNPGTKLVFLLVYLVLLAGAVATGTSYFRAFEIHHRAEVELQISSIVETKVSELAQWRKERLGDANTVFRNTVFTALVRRFFAHPGDVESRHQLLSWMRKIQMSYQYDGVFLLDARGGGRLAAGDLTEPVPAELAADAAQAQEIGQVVFMDLHRHAPNRPVYLGVLVPIVDESGFDAPLGVLVLRIDPAIYLNSLIQRWPSPSPTCEALLVRREGDEVVFLNELRHRQNTALALRYPVSDIRLPAAKSVRGEFGVREGVDYRGVPVVAASLAVPDSPWFIVAKVDQAEIYAPVRREAWRTGGIVALLLLTTAFASVAFWRQRNEALLRRQLSLESERNILVERLGMVTRQANDIILLLDETGRVVEANDRALATYGYTLEELQRLPPGGLRSPEKAGDLLAQIGGLVSSNGVVYETVHRCKDGTTFPVEVSARSVESEGQKFSLGIYRDITERKSAEMKMEKQNALLNALINSPSDIVIFSLDRNYCYTAFNEKHRQEMRTVWQVDIQIGCNLLESMADPQLRQLAQQSIDRALGGEVFTEIQLQPELDIYYEFAWNPIRQKDGIITGVTAFIRDITERKRAETALRESEDKFKFFFEHSGVGKSLTRPSGAIQVNQAFCNLLGYSQAELQHRTWQEISHPADLELTQQAVDALISGKQNSTRFIKRYLHKNGSAVWTDVSSTLRRNEAGQPLYFITSIIDITERKQAEAALEASEVRYRRLFESSKDGILILDAETGMVVDVNPFLIEMLGFSHEQLLEKKVWELGFLRDVFASKTNFDELQEKGYIRYEDLALETAEGNRIEVEFISNVYLVNQTKVVQCNIRDISDRKHAEEALQKTAQELQDKNASLERFTYTVSHDLKSPLVTIKTFAGFLEKDIKANDGLRMEKDLKFIQGAAEKMGRLLEELLDLSRIGRKMNPFVSAPLQSVVQEALDLVAGQIAQRGVTLQVSTEPIILLGDRPRLVEVFQNLVDNAVKFMGDQPAPRVEIGAEQTSSGPVFFVRDNGIGIDPRHHAKLFGLFEKLDPRSEGTGIGLALVKRIVEVHGGKIWAESGGLGQGTTFRFTLGGPGKPENETTQASAK